MVTPASLTPEEERKLVAAFEVLKEFSDHELPVVKFNCRKAKNELWQALFELDLLPAREGDKG
jgi:prephenate dehydratase